MKRDDCQRGGVIHTGFSVCTFRGSLDKFIHKPQIKSQIRGRRCKTKQEPRLFHSRDIAVCPESPPPRINTSWLARRLFIYPGDIFQRIFARQLRFFCPLEWRCRCGGTWRVIPPPATLALHAESSPSLPGIRYPPPHLTQSTFYRRSIRWGLMGDAEAQRKTALPRVMGVND